MACAAVVVQSAYYCHNINNLFSASAVWTITTGESQRHGWRLPHKLMVAIASLLEIKQLVGDLEQDLIFLPFDS